MKYSKEKKYDDAREHKTIDEKEIQKKLYGETKIKKEETLDVQNNKYAHIDIKDKLYADTGKKPGKKEPLPERELFEEKLGQKSAGGGEEKEQLKHKVTLLEEENKKLALQNERLKIRLLQKRKISNATFGLLNVLLKKIIKNFIAVIVVIVIATLVFILSSQKPAVNQAKIPTNASVKPAVKHDQGNKPAEKITANITAEDKDFKKQIIVEQTETSILEKKRYTIQVAEYADEAAAMKFVGELKGQGFFVFIDTVYRKSNPEKPYLKVNVGTFDDFNEAKKYNDEFIEKTKIRDSFIKEIK
ncbi:MAG: SPOR domain-containing protein [Candidatus Omnitrophica bacterium]|nr:SPOR domain-containing protein [Candidatus Omnitrophota bacterium]